MATTGIHSMVWVGSFGPEEARRAIESSAQAGYDLIELPPVHPADVDVPGVLALLEEHGLQVSATLGLDDSNDVSSDDPDVVAAGRRRLSEGLALVRDLGGTFFGGVLYSKLGKYDRPVTQRGWDNSIAAIGALADEAAEAGISIGLEVVNRYESNVLNTAEQALRYIDEVGRDNVVVHLDTYHMNIEEVSFAAAVKEVHAAGRLGYVHLGESHRGQLGTGSVPWEQFFDALREVGYDGVTTFESFSSQVVHPTLSAALSIWRDTWTDGMALAIGAREFIRDGLGR